MRGRWRVVGIWRRRRIVDRPLLAGAAVIASSAVAVVAVVSLVVFARRPFWLAVLVAVKAVRARICFLVSAVPIQCILDILRDGGGGGCSGEECLSLSRRPMLLACCSGQGAGSGGV